MSEASRVVLAYLTAWLVGVFAIGLAVGVMLDGLAMQVASAALGAIWARVVLWHWLNSRRGRAKRPRALGLDRDGRELQ